MTTDYAYATEVEVPSNPFPGLRPFEFHESNLYFGRDGQSERMLAKLAARRFVAVVGTSGSGKSSLVRAGLLPALFGGFMPSAGSNWRVALMRSGSDPLGNLARALNAPNVFGSDIEENAALQTVITEATLRRGSLGLVEAVRQTRMPSNENLLVIVDRFEELFRFARVAEGERYRNEAAAFVKLLLAAVVIPTSRSRWTSSNRAARYATLRRTRRSERDAASFAARASSRSSSSSSSSFRSPPL
jgi:energy-coupling factor transporter ATP-binding protein EcfA2